MLDDAAEPQVPGYRDVTPSEVPRQPIDWRAQTASMSAAKGEHDHTHRRVLAVIEQRIIDGSLRAGDRLPGERELA